MTRTILFILAANAALYLFWAFVAWDFGWPSRIASAEPFERFFGLVIWASVVGVSRAIYEVGRSK